MFHVQVPGQGMHVVVVHLYGMEHWEWCIYVHCMDLFDVPCMHEYRPCQFSSQGRALQHCGTMGCPLVSVGFGACLF
jgi:hypothetical protein